MQKGVLVLVLLAMALVVAGCQGGGKGAVSSSSTPFIGGSEGLRVSFLDNAPPKEILDNKQMSFDVILRLENVGERDIPASKLKVTLGGIYPQDFVETGKTKPENLQNVLYSGLAGKTDPKYKLDGVKKDPEGGKIQGGIDEIKFEGLTYKKLLEGNAEFPLQADFCYNYQTKAVGDFCMRQDLTRPTAGVCDVKGTKPMFSSGAPLHVVSLDEAVGGAGKVILKFTLKADGTGSFFKPEAIAATNKDGGCEKGNFAKENIVRVTLNTGVTGLSCSGFDNPANVQEVNGDVRLTNGEASITCIQSGVSFDAVQKATVTVNYNHLISASTKLLVKHLPGFESSSGGGGIQTAGVTGACQPGAKKACTTTGGKAGTQECIEAQWTVCVENGGALT